MLALMFSFASTVGRKPEFFFFLQCSATNEHKNTDATLIAKHETVIEYMNAGFMLTKTHLGATL